MTETDYLWDPNAKPDAEIQNLERVLRVFSACALNLDRRVVSISKPAPAKIWKRIGMIAAAASFIAVGIVGLYFYRLSWSEQAPWSITIARADGAPQRSELHVGERVVTTTRQSATLEVARIGTVVIGPESEAKLLRTESNRHRLELEHGRLHAKIWAPPNYFGVSHGDDTFIDMGCEFDLRIDSPRSGALSVQSGWVFYTVGYEEALVPEHYTLFFSGQRAQIPIRSDANENFRQWVNELDANPDSATTVELAGRISNAARDEDFFSLHMLLRRHPQLAAGPLYDRLALALKAKPNESQRRRWAQGDRDAANEWWKLYPKHPKEWWVNWKDAL